MRILILRGGALGDFLVTLPALQLLRHRWPTARIELVGNARAAELAVQSGLLSDVHSQHEGRWSALFDESPLAQDFLGWLDAFDVIISYWPDVDGALRGHFRHRRDTFIASHARPTTHPAAKHFCDALSPLGLATADYRYRMTPAPAAVGEAARRLGDFKEFVAIHPGSGSTAKNWPIERWIEVGIRLQKPILAVTGEVEQPVIAWPTNVPVLHAHQWSLPVLAAALQQASLYLGHDTGISHLAAAVGTQCLLLFGPTDPQVWSPPGENVRALRRSTSLADIDVEHVMASLAGS